jgi:hypothetical protein
MKTVLIQINNEKAYKLLEDLEDLQLITVIRKNSPASPKLSEKYAGKLPPDVAESLQNFVTQTRDEWSKRIT